MELTCDPGTYYMVVSVRNNESKDVWKAQKVYIERNKITKIEAVFKDLQKSGYIIWNE